MEVYRDIADDVTMQVEDAKSMVLRTTIATMGGLFISLLGFIVVADVTIYRSRQPEIALAEDANRTLEDRVKQRTRELEDANRRALETQDRLVRAEKLSAIGKLAGGVAHDLRNSLGPIKNAAYYLKKKLGSSELARTNPAIGQFLQILDDEVKHSNQIISDLLAFSRVAPPSLTPTSLADVIEKTLSRLEETHGVHIVKDLEPDLPEVPADGGQLQRVFMNLARNALDAMPDGGRLTVSARHADGFVEATFVDTGAGIGAEDMHKVFEPLFTTKSSGTGLGLSVCQQIMSNHGGTINVASKPGVGSTFSVRLPLSSDRPEEA
jgi:signal transduction histidine kinase